MMIRARQPEPETGQRLGYPFVAACASCKRIRVANGHWVEVEVGAVDPARVQTSHGICPDCAAKLYPQIYTSDMVT